MRYCTVLSSFVNLLSTKNEARSATGLVGTNQWYLILGGFLSMESLG